VTSELELALRAAWSRETSEDPDEWSPANPSRGQCAVTALVIRELLGGEILIATVRGEPLGPAYVGEPDPRIYGSERLERMRSAVRERL
jgi:hypothetical protein